MKKSFLSMCILTLNAFFAEGASKRTDPACGRGSVGAPLEQGFDYFYGYLCQAYAHNSYPAFLYMNKDTARRKNVMPLPVKSKQSGVVSEKHEYRSDFFFSEAENFISKNQVSPFFLSQAITLPHANSEAGDPGNWYEFRDHIFVFSGTMYLKAGENILRLVNNEEAMPDIDRIDLALPQTN